MLVSVRQKKEEKSCWIEATKSQAARVKILADDEKHEFEWLLRGKFPRIRRSLENLECRLMQGT